MNVRRTTRSFGHRHRPPVLHGRLNGEFPTLRSQQTQICRNLNARTLTREDMSAAAYRNLTLECTGPTSVIALRSGVEV